MLFTVEMSDDSFELWLAAVLRIAESTRDCALTTTESAELYPAALLPAETAALFALEINTD